MKNLATLIAAAAAAIPTLAIAQTPPAPARAAGAPAVVMTRPAPIERHTVVSTVRTSMLATICRQSENPAAATMCSGYILGAFDQASISGAICPGANVNTIDVLTMGRTALTTEGADAVTPSSLLGNVFRKTWPCS